jgi:L-lactate dehydrogenase complex protein LldF
METSSDRFPEASRRALGDKTLQTALAGVEKIMPGIRQTAIDQLSDFAGLRARATEIRDRTLQDLEQYLDRFEARVIANGGTVHRARTGEEACRIVAGLCEAAGNGEAPVQIIKSKSMVTEEIDLNLALEARGMQVTETDLGEYIIQLRNERPSHILAPSLHVSLAQVAEAFRRNHRLDPQRDLTDPTQLLSEARQVLREKFLSADVGITGANFLVAETGAAVIVTNEGNADLTATLPGTHIVVTGVEKVVPGLEEVGVLLRLLARSAIGERLSNYTTFVHGPRQPAETTGPENYHVVLVDNGRRDLLGTEFQDVLRCIRCSACINHCPVYTSVGGHAYGSVYSGPIGAVLTPALVGIEAAGHLPNASTLCGRCEAVCPVSIPLPKLLRHWRERQFSAREVSRLQRWGLAVWRWLCGRPMLYRTVLGAAAIMLRSLSVPGARGRRWIRRLPAAGAAWTGFHDLPAPVGETFQARWRRMQVGAGKTDV